MFAHISLGDQKRDLRQRASLQIVVVVTLLEFDTWIILPLREEDESIEDFERIRRGSQPDVITLPTDLLGIQQVDNSWPVQTTVFDTVGSVTP